MHSIRGESSPSTLSRDNIGLYCVKLNCRYLCLTTPLTSSVQFTHFKVPFLSVPFRLCLHFDDANKQTPFTVQGPHLHLLLLYFIIGRLDADADGLPSSHLFICRPNPLFCILWVQSVVRWSYVTAGKVKKRWGVAEVIGQWRIHSICCSLWFKPCCIPSRQQVHCALWAAARTIFDLPHDDWDPIPFAAEKEEQTRKRALVACRKQEITLNLTKQNPRSNGLKYCAHNVCLSAFIPEIVFVTECAN